MKNLDPEGRNLKDARSLEFEIRGACSRTKAMLPGLLLALVGTVLSARAVEREWVASGLTPSAWSNPNNWNPAGVPEDGDDLVFNRFTGGLFMINDLANLTVKSLRFSFDAGPYQLDGNPLGLAGAIESEGGSLVQIHCNIRLEGTGQILAYSGLPSHSADMRLTGAIDLNGRSLFLLARQDTMLDLAGLISGNGSIQIRADTGDYFGVGTVKFSGLEPNTFAGSVTLRSQSCGLCIAVGGANLVLDKQSGPAVTGPLIIGTNANVFLDRPHQIADDAAVSLGARASFLLQGNAETIGNLSLIEMAVDDPFNVLPESLVDTGGATLSVTGSIISTNLSANRIPRITGKLGLPPGNHLISISGNQFYGLNIDAQIVGDGGFTKTGSAGLLLQGDNIFNGEVAVTQGVLEARHGNALGSVAGFSYLSNNATLILNNAAIYGESLFVRGDLSLGPDASGSWLEAVGSNVWSGPIILDTNLVVTGYVDSHLNLNGLISGAGGLRCLSGTVELSGTDANTFTGRTVVKNRLLLLNKSSGVAAFNGPLIVGDEADLSLMEVRWLQNYQCVNANLTIRGGGKVNLNDRSDDFGPITLYGGVIQTGTGVLGIYGKVTAYDGPVNTELHGNLHLPPGPHEFAIHDTEGGLNVYSQVNGPGGLLKTGSGSLYLGGANTYAGLTLINAGSVIAGNAASLGNPSTGTTVNDGASLTLSAIGATVPEPIFISGAGDAGQGALNVFGNVTLQNPFPSIFACLDLTTNATIRVETGGALTVNGFISGIGPLTKAGPGSLVLANINPNTYSGDTFVAEGVLNLSKPNLAVAVPGNLIVGPAPLNSSAIARWSTSGGMNPGAIATINARSLLDLNGNSLTLSRLNLNDGGDAQTGAGTLTFPTFGMVAVGSLNQFGSHASSSFSGNIGLPANAPLTFAVGAYAPFAPFDFNPELDIVASIAAPAENPNFERAGIAKSGPGTMRLLGNTSFNGRVEVLGGTFIAASGTALGSTFDGTFVQNNARLALAGGVNVENEILVLNSTAEPALEGLAGDSYWSGPVIMQRHSTVGALASSLLHLAGVISGTANFTKVGAGTLRFGGGANNTFTGDTFVHEGVLLLTKNSFLQAVPRHLIIGSGLPGAPATLVQYHGHDQVWANLTVNAGGLLDLNGYDEYAGPLTLNGGGDVQTGTGTLYIPNDGITVNPGANRSTITGKLGFGPGTHILNVGSGSPASDQPDLEISALISQTASAATLQKEGSGLLRLTANNTYSGLSVVNEGVLRVDGSQPQSHVQVNATGKLQGAGSVGGINFSGNGGVVSPGASPGVLRCSQFNASSSGTGILEIELNEPSPGSGHDQLWVDDEAVFSGVTLRASARFPVASNQQFVISRVLSESFGAFTGLPQNTSLWLGDQEFRISYTAGAGHDVVLTKIADVFRPVLRIEPVPPASVRLLWATGAPPFSLQSSTNLAATNWSLAQPSPAIIGTNNVVTNAADGAPRFYRLFKP